MSFADSVLGIVWAWNFAGLLGEELLNTAKEVLQRGARALDESRGTRLETWCWQKVLNSACVLVALWHVNVRLAHFRSPNQGYQSVMFAREFSMLRSH